jgi:hypothetical protein
MANSKDPITNQQLFYSFLRALVEFLVGVAAVVIAVWGGRAAADLVRLISSG